MKLVTLKDNRQDLEKFKDVFRGSKALKVRKIFKAMDEELNELETLRNDLVIKYGKEVENGEYSIDRNEDPENYQKFIEEYSDAMDADFDHGVTMQLTEDDIKDFTARDLELLEILGIEVEE